MSDFNDNEKKVFCPSCGGENKAGNTFCMNCGERIIPLAEDLPSAADTEIYESPGSPVPPVYESPGSPVPPVYESPGSTAPPVYESSGSPVSPVYESPGGPVPPVYEYTGGNTNTVSSEAAPVQYYNNEPNPYYNNNTGAGNIYETPVTYTQAAATAGNQSKGLAIASLVCGIISIVCCYLTIFASIGGLITGIIALTKKLNGRGMAIAGVIMSAVSILLYGIILIAIMAYGFSDVGEIVDIYDGFSNF